MMATSLLFTSCEESDGIDDENLENQYDDQDDQDDDTDSDDSDDSDVDADDDDSDADSATISLSNYNVAFENEVDKSETVVVTTNQANSTIAIALEEGGDTYFDVSIVENIMIIKTLTFNTSTVDALESKLYVSAGEGSAIVRDTLSITQQADVVATLLLSGADLVGDAASGYSVGLESAMGDSASITIETNQESSDISFVLEEGASDFFEVAKGDNSLTIKTLTVNSSIEDVITYELYISAGVGENIAKETIVITQAVADMATISLSGSDLSGDAASGYSVELENVTDDVASVTVATNQESSTIKAEIVGGSSDFEVSYSGTTVTVKSLGVNTGAAPLTAEVTVTAGTEGNPASTTFTVTQSNSVVFTTDETSLSFANTSGSQATATVITNLDVADVTGAITSGDSYFEVAQAGAVFTVTTKGENTTDSPFEGVLTLSLSGQSDITIPLSQEGTTAAVGDIYNNEGIVYYVSEDKKTIMITSLEEESIVWGTYTDATVGGDSRDDGAANTLAISTYVDYSAEAFPATAWCLAKGDGWYFPSSNECLVFLAYAYDTVFNGKITAAGGDVLTASTYYWSSSEYSASNAYAPRNKEGTLSTGNFSKTKAEGRPIRAVKVINL